jgi:DNA mismatch repair ATPase MutS
VSPLAAASAMRNVDSLQEGVSAFYAEIQRLRAVCNWAAGDVPVLFLLDEILHGTNSHDRRLGAEAVIEDLLGHGAIGLITTHDLALAQIADRLAPRAANVHFEDQWIEGRMSFDYRLRPGVVPKGNGLILMRLLGFEV